MERPRVALSYPRRMSHTLYQILGRHAAPALPERKPAWLKVRAPGRPELRPLKQLMRELGLHTVCEEAQLPQHRRVLGARRRHLHDPGRRLHPELRLLRRRPRDAAGVRPGGARPRWPKRSTEMGLQHVVITSVDRDDLPNGGAETSPRRIRQIHAAPAGLLGGGADPRLPGHPRRAPRSCSTPRPTSQPQPGDGPSGSTSAGPARRPLRARARDLPASPSAWPPTCPPSPASSSAWAREWDEVLRCHARPARGATSTSSRSASTSARRTATCRSPATTPRTSSPSCATSGIGDGIQARRVRARSCAPATTPGSRSRRPGV